MTADEKHKFVKALFTINAAGKETRLGLNLSMPLMERISGHLFLDRSGKNTRFIIHLPSAGSSQASISSPSNVRVAQKKPVLI